MCHHKKITIWVAFNAQKKAWQLVDWLIKYPCCHKNGNYLQYRNNQGFRNDTGNISFMCFRSFIHSFIHLFIYLFSDYQIKRCLEFTWKLSWFSTLLFWNKTRGQNKTIIFLQNKGFPRRRRCLRRNCEVFWKGKLIKCCYKLHKADFVY